jgi:hypothetical protein
MRKLFGLLVLAIALTGCITLTPYYMSTPFNEADFAIYNKQGNSTITGQAFLKTVGGEVKYGAGNIVCLYPANAYMKEVRTTDNKMMDIKNLDLRWKNFIKETTADANGRFEFKNLIPGEYYIECAIYWGVAGKYGVERTGALVRTKVRVNDGETINAILTSN